VRKALGECEGINHTMSLHSRLWKTSRRPEKGSGRKKREDFVEIRGSRGISARVRVLEGRCYKEITSRTKDRDHGEEGDGDFRAAGKASEDYEELTGSREFIF